MYYIEEVFGECEFYLNILKKSKKGCMLMRGTRTNLENISYRERINKQRIPKNIPEVVHKKLNGYFSEQIGWPARDGVFCFGVNENHDTIKDLGYGKSHLLFPKGEFLYAYNPEIFDLFDTYLSYFEQKSDASIEDFVKSIKYSTSDLEKVMAIQHSEERSVELMINCSGYYLVNVTCYKELLNKIWL